MYNVSSKHLGSKQGNVRSRNVDIQAYGSTLALESPTITLAASLESGCISITVAFKSLVSTTPLLP